MTILVAMPYYGCPDLVERAVRCVLHQTVRDLRLLVIGDGETPPLSGVRDSRLEVFTMAVNRGPYFALQTALLASPHEWFAVHGADDTSDPDHLENHMAVADAAGVEAVYAGAVWWGEGTERFREAAYEVGLYTPRRLLSFGAYNPAVRIAQDTLMIHLLRITGSFAYTTRPTYHRIKRSGSLTTSPETALRSKLRLGIRAENRMILRQARRLRRPDRIRAYRESLVPAEVQAALSAEAALLQEQLGQVAA